MRPLTLHASALTDPEYSLYTTALLDLAGEDTFSHPHDDSYYAALVVSARETRAWIRGRYTELQPAQVDAILKLFCPNIAPADTLSGGQFFAALRLVTHIRHGKPLDGGLVFVQAHPDDAASPPLQTSSTPAPLKAIVTDSPVHSRNTSREGHLIDDSVPSTPPALPPKPLLSPTPSSSTNPFINRTKSREPPTLSTPSTATPTLPPALRVKSTPAAAALQQPVIPPLPPRKSMSALVEERGKAPPPPPPRPNTLTPSNSSPFAFWHNQNSGTPTNPNVLIQQSLQAGRIAQSLKEAEKKLEKERVLEVLKSSAPSTNRDFSKRTHSESPNRGVAVLAISAPGPSAISRSYSVSSGSDSSSAEQAKQTKGPALPPRRRVSSPNSAWSGRSGRTEGGRSVISTSSMREVATASVGSRRTSSSRERRAAASPPPVHPDLVPQPSPVLPVLPALAGEKGPPPTHPGRKPPPPVPSAPASATGAVFPDGPDQDMPTSPGPGVFRSRSLHQHPVSPSVGGAGTPLPPLPPPRPRPRRRPNSVQFSPTIASVTNGLGSPRRAPSPTLTERTDRSGRSVNTVLSSPASLPARTAGASRHLSLSQQQGEGGAARARRADSLSGHGVLANGGGLKDGLRDRWESLQPRLDKARWKAEAGLSRRGYVAHRGSSAWRDREGEARLVDTSEEDGEEDEDGGGGVFGRRGTAYGGEAAGDAPSVDRDYRASDDDEGHTRSTSAAALPRRPWEVERDEMKWPVAPGEGWTPL
ncbi:uncharacterized protein PHACADRAFT_253274 [Phanerochaete carnosa HHB-10118-sp]|uniref:Uncharacterized protein n=1 Tax=Phanerochaete carnosa (strain HHB-10118-sp) TaxID=650164 RepID=K5VXE7_PHACS|nr:uncharacterized protein PHACADRAFT_253274 [Phanerochaete carnosa HHB-10118-sp]EKM56248.1 hypothetical protein PHACADRAFT_253274 [Phanerochaete carnosa HHB-10118-sp]